MYAYAEQRKYQFTQNMKLDRHFGMVFLLVKAMILAHSLIPSVF